MEISHMSLLLAMGFAITYQWGDEMTLLTTCHDYLDLDRQV